MTVKSGSRIVADLTTTDWNGNVNPYYLTQSYSIETFSHRNFKSSVDDNGGPFFLTKSGYRDVQPLYWPWNGARGLHAPIWPLVDVGWNPQNPMSDSDMRSKGTTAISRVLPTNPSFNLAQALGEAREGFPRLVLSGLLKKQTKRALNAGDEYLNVEFGWKPLVNDIKNLCHTVKHHSEIMRSYKKHSDTKLIRRYEHPIVNTSQVFTYNGTALVWSGSYQKSGVATILKQTKSASWFEGCFRYHIPIPDTTMGKLGEYSSEANKLLGLRLTPELVWNLTPWTWMADWFGNTGDVLRNISALGHDGLAMQYGYFMASSDDVIDMRHTHTDYNGFMGNGPAGSTVFVSHKKRLPATPFGFDVALESLSRTQVAVLAALGLSRGGRPWTEKN